MIMGERKESLEKILKDWSNETSISFGYKYNWEMKELVIYTTCPGILIGFKGETIEKYRERLNKYFFEKEIKIRFEEIDGMIY